ncbi:unnamed protein product, partial [Ectocarpus sp. 13 AM-2016]
STQPHSGHFSRQLHGNRSRKNRHVHIRLAGHQKPCSGMRSDHGGERCLSRPLQLSVVGLATPNPSQPWWKAIPKAIKAAER